MSGVKDHMNLRFIGKMIVVLGIVTGSSAWAEASGDWDLSGFTSQTVAMGVATNKKTGHKMHVIRLKDGSIVAMVPAMPLWEMMRERSLGDMAGP